MKISCTVCEDGSLMTVCVCVCVMRYALFGMTLVCVFVCVCDALCVIWDDTGMCVSV